MSEVLKLDQVLPELTGTFFLPLSKSMTNRALLLQSLYPGLQLTGQSTADDSRQLAQALAAPALGEIFVGAGGTTLRFALAYWASRPGAEVTLSGTPKLNARPIGPLVDALRSLGAEIEYLHAEGCAPLKVRGKQLTGNNLHLGHVASSQFVTALMLIAPTLPEGLTLSWDSIVSSPYLVMTAALMREAGLEVRLSTEGVSVPYQAEVSSATLVVEPDWSALGFWCEAVALSRSADLFFPGFVDPSTQGDSKVVHYFEPLGVGHKFTPEGLRLFKKPVLTPGKLSYNLRGEPDLAQPLITTMVARQIPFEVYGLETLPMKECDRIDALREAAEALGVSLECTPASIRCTHYPVALQPPTEPFLTHHDHRVAMSLAPLSLLFPIAISGPEVVSKSYPEFWAHWQQLRPMA